MLPWGPLYSFLDVCPAKVFSIDSSIIGCFEKKLRFDVKIIGNEKDPVKKINRAKGKGRNGNF
jgi:hypothetical protein